MTTTASTTPATKPASPMRRPAYRRLMVGWVATNLGDSALYLVLAIWVRELTGSDAAGALVFLFIGLPALLAPFAGQLADRVHRRPLLIGTNLGTAAVVLTLLPPLVQPLLPEARRGTNGMDGSIHQIDLCRDWERQRHPHHFH